MRFTGDHIGKRVLLEIDPRGLEGLAQDKPSMELVGDIKDVNNDGVLLVHGERAVETYIPNTKVRGHSFYGTPDPTAPY